MTRVPSTCDAWCVHPLKAAAEGVCSGVYYYMLWRLLPLCADAMPVEITDFCWKYNLQRLQSLPEVKGCEAKLRENADGTPYVTDNRNYIVDLYFKTPIKVVLARHLYWMAPS